MGRRYPFGEVPVTLGRSEECDVSVSETSISRRHAIIEPRDGGCVLTDLQSTNGTYVNDVRVQAPYQLRNGDYIRVGNCIYRYLAGGNIEAGYHEEIYRLTILDGLTQINNRRYLMEFLDTEVERSYRYSRPFSVLLLDIDRFKSINDRYGHLCGDYVLREMAALIRPAVRKGDLFARYGGEEFALALVETCHGQALDKAERVRSLVADHSFQFGDNTLQVTVSIGVASRGDCLTQSPTALLDEADTRLYRAKQAGRNRVVGQTSPLGCLAERETFEAHLSTSTK
jgi:diguanylate cyclase (GGDEF)-like protein